MDDLNQTELTIARLHRERLARMIGEQAARVERFRKLGANRDLSVELLALLIESLELLDDFIARKTGH